MNDRLNSLESTVTRGIKASEQVSISVNSLLLEFRERDVRHEYERIANEKLTERVEDIIMKVDDYIESKADVISRCEKAQSRWDEVVKSMSSTSGKLIMAAIGLGILVMLGLDPSAIVKKGP